jgi:uncharacterized protein
MSTAKDEAKLAVRVTPGARRNSVVALKEGVWHVKIAAPPVEGKANTELIAFLSRMLDVHRSDLRVIRGASSRNKLLSVSSLNPGEVASRMSAGLNC